MMRAIQVLCLAMSLILWGGCSSITQQFSGKAKTASQGDRLTSGEMIFDPNAQPFLMAAEAKGNFIVFAITNQTDREYRVSPTHFALIVQGTRQLVPYSPEVAAIDVPSTLPPQGTIQGRAIFYDFPAPEGHRLVFKPGNEATFAVIQGAASSIRTLPPTKTSQANPSRSATNKSRSN